jgi:hypothetical protein
MSEQDHEVQRPMPPTPAPSRWGWSLLLAIPGGFVGSYVFGILGLILVTQSGYISADTAAAVGMVALLGFFFGLPQAMLGAVLGSLISWPLAKYAARKWGVGGALLAGILAGTSGGLLIGAGLVWFALL